MDTGCLEIVVKRANNPLKKVMQIVAAALAAVCVLGLFVFGVFSLIGAVLFAALAWYLSQDLNIDYEYAYVDRELRVAKIINKSRRKEVAVYDLNEMEVMAPEKSHHLDSYKPTTPAIWSRPARESATVSASRTRSWCWIWKVSTRRRSSGACVPICPVRSSGTERLCARHFRP